MEQKDPAKHPSESTDTGTAAASILKLWPWLALLAIILFAAAIRIRLLQVPLERDEGEFAYMGQLMLQGIPPYRMAYNMKLPGLYAGYAIIMAIFGQTIAGIHIGLMLANAAAIVLLFILARRLFDVTAAVVASACYALLSLSPSVLGTSAHATQFIVPLALGATLLLLRSLDSGNRTSLFLSGLLYGVAFLVKQHAVFFIAFALIYFMWITARKAPFDIKSLGKGTALLFIASIIPFGITCTLLYAAGVFQNFWFWTFAYSAEYVTENPLSKAPELLAKSALLVIKHWVWIWIIAAVGFTSVLWSRTMRSKWAFLVGMTLFSFLAICPGFYFRNHYFVTMLPSIALLAGIATSALIRAVPASGAIRVAKAIPPLLVAAALIYPAIRYREFFFIASPVRASQMMYGVSPFPYSAEIGAYIRARTTAKDSIAVFGSEPQICFHAGRKSATGYIYMYPLMEPQIFSKRMQWEAAREMENSRSKYAVRVNVPNSWVRRMDSDPAIFHWADRYFADNYRLAGFVDIFQDGRSDIYWDSAARNSKPKSQYNLLILEHSPRYNPGDAAHSMDTH